MWVPVAVWQLANCYTLVTYLLACAHELAESTARSQITQALSDSFWIYRRYINKSIYLCTRNGEIKQINCKRIPVWVCGVISDWGRKGGKRLRKCWILKPGVKEWGRCGWRQWWIDEVACRYVKGWVGGRETVMLIGRLMWVYYQQISNCCTPVLTYWLTDWRHQWLTDCWSCAAFCYNIFFFVTAVVYGR